MKACIVLLVLIALFISANGFKIKLNTAKGMAIRRMCENECKSKGTDTRECVDACTYKTHTFN